jgi:hypothetical protein
MTQLQTAISLNMTELIQRDSPSTDRHVIATQKPVVLPHVTRDAKSEET